MQYSVAIPAGSDATAGKCGAQGAIGDRLARVIIVPATLSPGAVQIKDGASTAVTIFAGGANSLTELKPIVVEIGAASRAGGWAVVTGANAAAVAVGGFS